MGIAATSVLRYVVTPRSMLDGTNASAIQRRRRARVMVASPAESAGVSAVADAPLGVAAGSAVAPRRAMKAHTAMSATRPTYATVHARLWAARGSVRSRSSGYASSATMLPRLLAA